MKRLLILIFFSAAPAHAEPPLDLVAAIERARPHHERAALTRELAEAEVRQAWAAVLPRLALESGAGFTGGTGTRAPARGRFALDATLGLSAPLFEPRAVPWAKRAEFIEKSVQAQAEYDLLELAFAVADAWY